MRFISVVFALALSGAAHAGGVDRLKAFVSGAKTAEADFTQTVSDKSGRITQQASGKMMFARPGKFRWDYAAPYEQVIVSDGVKLWLYDADLDQVSVKSLGDVVAGTPAAEALREGDLLLAVNGQPVNRFRDVELATRAPLVKVTVLRDGREIELDLATEALGGGDIDRLLLWAGAVLHAPHRAMAAQRGIPPEGVFVAFFSYGSPATRHQLFAGRRIVEVDGRPTPDLDAFIAAVQGRPDRSSVRMRTVTWNGSTEVITLKLDRHYWPAYELRRTPGGWLRTAVD